MNNCAYCGETQAVDFEIRHLQGSVGKVCPYSICGSRWSNFKIRLAKFMKHNDPNLKWFAYFVNDKVFNENKPAIIYDKQLQILRKRAEPRRQEEQVIKK